RAPETFQWPEAEGTAVMLTVSGGELLVRVRGPAEADALRSALGVDPSQQLIRTTLTTAPRIKGRSRLRSLIQPSPELAMLGIVIATVAIYRLAVGRWLSVPILFVGPFLSLLSLLRR